MSSIRSLIVGLLLSLWIFLLMNARTMRKFFVSLVACLFTGIVFVFAISHYGILRQRFADMAQEMKLIEEHNLDSRNGTLSLRLEHFIARQQYVRSNAQHFVFGIGNIVDEDFAPTFKGDSAQLDTADISWSDVVLRLGYVGMALFVALWLIILVALWMKKNESRQALALFSFLLPSLVVISFCSADIATGFFYVFVSAAFIGCYGDDVPKPGGACSVVPPGESAETCGDVIRRVDGATGDPNGER
ncbi:MAG: hypothetical protein MJ025_01260 [Victivallaceae bacterium]|nr:hypothetical protein [Victivallaceae bacterium]